MSPPVYNERMAFTLTEQVEEIERVIAHLEGRIVKRDPVPAVLRIAILQSIKKMLTPRQDVPGQ